MVCEDKEVRLGALLERQKSKAGGQEDALLRAITEKERLVGYDRDSAKQTAVIDDQSDFFEIDSNIWLSQEEKAFLKQKEEEMEAERRSERDKVYVTFDLLGRKVTTSRGKPESQEAGQVEAPGAEAAIPPNPALAHKPFKFKTKRRYR